MHKKYQIAKPFIDEKDIRGVVKVMKSGHLSLGPKYIEFEKDLGNYVGSKYVCSVSSGTAGLHLIVRALGLKEGDEVLTTSFSFIASTNCLLFERVTPVFVDITEDDYSIDIRKLKSKITRKTKAILPVHLFGHAVPMEPILAVAKEYGLKVIEDSCEGLGTKYNNKQVGTFGDAGVFAFYPNKQMTTGEGGAIVTDNEDVYLLCKSMRNQGRNNQGDWLVHERLGFNYRMNEMNASLGITQLKKLDWMIKKKQEVFDWYTEYLSDCDDVSIPKIQPHTDPAWFVYVIRVFNNKRDSLLHALNAKNIQVKQYFPAIHKQPFIQETLHKKIFDLPMTETIASETLALPFYIGLTKKDIRYITDQIKSNV